MSPVSVTCRRTLSRLRNLYTTALLAGGFLAASAAVFAFALAAAEGTHQALSSVWALSVAPFLPVLAAFFAADAWCEERQSGRIDLLLTVAVREREIVLGKAVGVWFALAVVTLLSLASCLLTLAFLAPAAFAGVRVASFVPALFILGLQGALWTAVSVAVSTMFARTFAAVATSLAVLVGLPRGLWAAALQWMPGGRLQLGEMPLDAMVADVASGLVPTGIVLLFVILTALFLFLSSKGTAFLRLPGRGSRKARLSTSVAMVLSVVCAVACSALAFRLDTPLDLQLDSVQTVSARMRRVLSDTSGRVTVTAFLPRKSPEFRTVARYLRALKRQADTSGGLALTVQFVDPEWDIGAAGRLVRLGVKENAVVFEKGSRLVSVGVRDGADDGIVGSALRSVALPPQHRDVYWTTGHGEAAFDSYGPWGVSDIARVLVRNGYCNRALDLSADRAIPADCALIAIAGARDAFSRTELARLDAYLRGGGRLLVLMGPSAEGGVSALLPAWGVRPLTARLTGARTLSGMDVIVTDFADHAVSAGFEGARLVLEKPLAFEPSAAVKSGTGADRLTFSPLASVGGVHVMAAVERGGAAGADLAVRPTRIVVVGDPTFVENGQLAARGNANGAFFLNAVAYLSGTETFGGAEDEPGVLTTGLDRQSRVRLLAYSAAAWPGFVFLVLAFAVLRGRRRK